MNRNKLTFSPSRGFTLVELIVVVTILALLSTIGFVSYSSYLSGVRDTNRLSQLVAISDGLELYRTKKTLPIPDDNIEIRANGTVIGYQGYVGINVLETIDYSKTGKDPKDKTYFSYYLTQDKKYYQLLTFLEEEENLETNLNINLLNKTKADTDYTNRYPKVSGKKLGILTQSGTNIPVQEISTLSNSGYLDVATTADSYNAHISDDNMLTGTGADIFSIFYHWDKDSFKNKELAKYDSSLVGYWDMETKNPDGTLKDFSQYGNHGVINGGPDIGSIDGISGRGTVFDGDDDYIRIPNSSSLNPTTGITVITISKSYGNGVQSGNYPRVIGKGSLTGSPAEQYAFWWNNYNAGQQGNGYFQFRLDTEDNQASTATITDNSFGRIDNTWNTIAFSYNGVKGYLNINGTPLNYDSGIFNGNINTSDKDLIIGNTSWASGFTRAYYGIIDEVRIYNRALSVSEIKNIYKYK